MSRHNERVARRNRELRRLLEDRRHRIMEASRSRIHDVREEGAAEGGAVLDEAEISEADIQTDLEFALLEMQRETLEKIEDALGQLNAGTYGDCVACGGEIPTRRLEALPFAIRCRACEAAREGTARPAPAISEWRLVSEQSDAAA
jgi:DnaK suppressor protein